MSAPDYAGMRERAEFALSNPNGPPGVLAMGRDVLVLLDDVEALCYQLDQTRRSLDKRRVERDSLLARQRELERDASSDAGLARADQRETGE